MSADQICAYCEHPRRLHLDGTGYCCASPNVQACSCPRFVANTDTETHEVSEQVLKEAEQRVGGTHLPTEIIPPAPAVPDMPDFINHPPHYMAHPSGVECIQITEHMNFNLGNALKYIWRASLKGAQLDDLKKAAWYVNREIERLSK